MIDSAPYLDKRNVALWEELNRSDFSIVIKESNELNYGCYCQNKDAVIYVLTSKPNPASFAHELLHLKYRIKGMLAGCCLKRMIQEHPLLKDVVTEDTVDVVTNSMEHVKMLPQFLAMGYSNSEFVSDYYVSKMYLFEYGDLCCRYARNRKLGVDRFIGKYCAMRADNNPDHSYNLYFGLMKQLDKSLYGIVERFWNDWLEYDTEKQREVWEPDYGLLNLDFINALGDYVDKK